MAAPNTDKPLFHHDPIDLSKDAIRLIKLCKGSSNYDKEIQCELYECFLNRIGGDAGVPYEALSYAWGQSAHRNQAQIVLNGKKFPITPSLYEALWCLRLRDEDRILWVDAICINQQDLREKGHQVEQMRLVYEKAQMVLVWLGTGDDETDYLMDFLRDITKRTNFRYDINTVQHIRSAIINERWTAVGDLNQRRLQAFRSLLQREWFRRIWVLQEVASARVARVVCGRKSISSKIFVLAPSLLEMSPDSHVQAILDVMPGHRRQTSWWSSDRTLETLLNKFGNCEASIERDRVYALLGISSDAYDSKVFPIDYACSMQDVMQATMTHLLFGKTCIFPIFKPSSGVFVSSTKELERHWPDQWSDPSLKRAFHTWDLDKLVESLRALQHSDQLATQVFYSLLKDKSPGYDPALKLLCSWKGFDINKKNQAGSAPLFLLAAEKKHHWLIEQIVARQDLKTAITDDMGNTPIGVGIRAENVLFVEHLLMRDDITVTPGEVKASLPMISTTTLRILLTHTKAQFSSRDLNYFFLNSVDLGRMDLIECLLDSGAHIDAEDDSGRTALTMCARNKNMECISLLLDRGVDRATATTALEIAVSLDHANMVKLLLDHNVDLEGQSRDGAVTLVEEAVFNGCCNAARILMDHGAEVGRKFRGCLWADQKWNHRPFFAGEQCAHSGFAPWHSIETTQRCTLLHLAARDNLLDIVPDLIGKGIDVNAENTDGHTPLHVAALWKHNDMVQLLLKHGADANNRDVLGRTSLTYAALHRHPEMIAKLTSHGARTDLVDDEGLTPFGKAATYDAWWKREQAQRENRELERKRSPLWSQ